MKHPMRLFCRNGWYHVEIERNRSKALKTRDKAKAKSVFKEMEKEWLRGRLFLLEDYRKATISELATDYCSRSNVSKWTTKKDELSLKLLSEAIGDIQIRTITRERMRKFKSVCLARGTASITINGYLRHIKAAFHYAVREGFLEKIPEIEMESVDDTLPRYLSPEQIKKILKKAKETDPDLWHYIMFNLYTGCRRRESLRLEWQKIDLKNRECRLMGKRSKGKGLKERVVRLLDPIYKVLYPVKKDVGKVFFQYHPDTVSKMFHALAKSCGVNARLHDLRHSCATYLLKSGVPPEVVQKILGHSQITTTQIYAKVLDEVVKKEMEKLRFQ